MPIRDTPPENFVCDLCVKLNVQILFGGDEVMGLPCPMISNKDILSFGGASHITSGKIFIEFVLSTLERKYSKENASRSVLNKIDSFGEHGRVFDSSRCILIWAGQHEGLTLLEAHRIGGIVAPLGCRPRVITPANGLTLCTSDENALEVNTELFPPTLYDQVSVVSGKVSVYNTTFKGERKNRGIRNTVTYLVGHNRAHKKEVWDFLPLVAETKSILGVEGTSLGSPDDRSDDKAVSPVSLVMIVQSKNNKNLLENLDKSSVCSYSPFRATAPGRWSFYNICPLPSVSIEASAASTPLKMFLSTLLPSLPAVRAAAEQAF